MLATREEMDICFIRTADQYLTGVKNGSFMELTDELLEKHCPDILAKNNDYEADLARGFSFGRRPAEWWIALPIPRSADSLDLLPPGGDSSPRVNFKSFINHL